jgi:two-component system cell cycle response regulator CtrA
MQSMRILLTAMDTGQTSDVVALLASHRFVLDRASNGEEALQFARLYAFDAVMFNTNMADPVCTEFVRRLRASGSRLPAVAVAHNIAPRDRARLLDMGADDVITLPCDGSELAARMRAVVRRSGGFTRSVLRAGAVELHMDSRMATAHGQELHLSPTEYRVLELMILRKNTLVSKSAVMDTLYGDMDEPEIKSIDVLMHRLRKRLAAAGVGTLISTVWGAGYIVRETSVSEPTIERPQRLGAGALIN